MELFDVSPRLISNRVSASEKIDHLAAALLVVDNLNDLRQNHTGEGAL